MGLSIFFIFEKIGLGSIALPLSHQDGFAAETVEDELDPLHRDPFGNLCE